MDDRMSRRRFLGVGAGAIGATMLAGCGSSSGGGGGAASSKSPLTIVTWGGTTQQAIDQALAKPFTKATGIPTKLTAPVDYGKFAAQIKSKRVTWDYIDAESWFPFSAPDLLEPLDMNVIKVEAADLNTVQGAKPITPWGVASGSYSFAIAYRTDHDGPHPTTWKEFFDTSTIPGKRAIYNWPFGMVEVALLGDGVPYDELYPLDLDRAFKKLDSVRKDLVFWNSGAELQQILSSGSAPFAYAWNNRVAYLAKRGQPVAVEWNENLQDGGYYIVPKHDPRKAEVMQFIAYALKPDRQAEYAKLTGYSPATKAGLDRMTAEDRKWLNADPANVAKAVGAIDAKWWGENMDRVTERWSKWAGA